MILPLNRYTPVFDIRTSPCEWFHPYQGPSNSFMVGGKNVRKCEGLFQNLIFKDGFINFLVNRTIKLLQVKPWVTGLIDSDFTRICIDRDWLASNFSLFCHECTIFYRWYYCPYLWL